MRNNTTKKVTAKKEDLLSSTDRFYTIETESRKQFYQIPKQFMKKESKYYKMDSDTKLLYGILSDRNSLSLKNGWFDECKRVYFIATIESLMDLTGWGNRKVVTKLKELRNFGLLISVQKGQGNPSWHYLLQVEVEECLESQSYQQKCQNDISRNVKTTFQEVSKAHSNKNDSSNIELNKNNLSIISEDMRLNDTLSEEEQISIMSEKLGLKLSVEDVNGLLYLADTRKIKAYILKIASRKQYIANPFLYILDCLKNETAVQNKIPTAQTQIDHNPTDEKYKNLEYKLLGWEE